MPKVSIIVPVYNVENYIKTCLDSLVNQTLSDIEIIIINDGSPDNSEKIIKEYEKKYSNIHYFKKENGGQATARNLGIKKATGEYIGFVDSDDYIDLDMYEKMYNYAKKEKADLVVCDYLMHYEDGSKELVKFKLNSDDMKANYIFNAASPCNKLIKRKVIIDNNLSFPEGIIYEDYAMIPLIAPLTNKVVYLENPFYHYIIHGNSTMNQAKFNKKFHNIITATDFMYQNIKNDDRYNDYYDVYEFVIICNLLRNNYLRLKEFKEAKYILDEASDWMKKNMPNWYKNKIYKNDFNLKERIYNYLIYKKKYNLLGFGKK